jgi:hypothetical protein
MWTLLGFMPDMLLPFVVMGLGLALILGLIDGSTLLTALGVVLVGMPLLAVVMPAVLDQVPGWALVLMLILGGLFVLRQLLTVLIGKEGAGVFLGHMLLGVVALPFRLLWWLMRMAVGRG